MCRRKVTFSLWMENHWEREKEKAKRGWKPLLLATSLGAQGIETWGPEKRETVGRSGEGELCLALWHTKRRTAAEAGITLTYFHIQAQSFLIHSWPLSPKVNSFFLRNKMNVIIKLNLRRYLWGLREIIFLRCLSLAQHSIGHWWWWWWCHRHWEEKRLSSQAHCNFLLKGGRRSQSRVAVTLGHQSLWHCT